MVRPIPKKKKTKVVIHSIDKNPFILKKQVSSPDKQLLERSKSFAELFSGLRKGSVLDIGPGGNKITYRVFSKLGHSTFAIDRLIETKTREGVSKIKKKIPFLKRFGKITRGVRLQVDAQGGKDMVPFEEATELTRYVPIHVETDGETKCYKGNIEELNHQRSELKNKKFDLAYFWGSLTGGGSFPLENFTVDYFLSEEKEPLEERNKMLETLKKQLNRNGKIAVVSTRFSHHGGVTRLEEEAQICENVMDHLSKLGAKKIDVYGITLDGAKQKMSEKAKYILSRMKGKETHSLHEETAGMVNEIRKWGDFRWSHFDAIRQNLKDMGVFDNELEFAVNGLNSYAKARKETSHMNTKHKMIIDAFVAKF